MLDAAAYMYMPVQALAATCDPAVCTATCPWCTQVLHACNHANICAGPFQPALQFRDFSVALKPSTTGHGYSHTPGIYTKEQTDKWKPIVAAVKKHNAIFFCQLWQTGRASLSGEGQLRAVALCSFHGSLGLIINVLLLGFLAANKNAHLGKNVAERLALGCR